MIDVGNTQLASGKWVGDVDFATVERARARDTGARRRGPDDAGDAPAQHAHRRRTPARRGPMTERAVLTVSQLSQQLAAVMEERFPAVWVEGEISNFKVYGSGHAYFTLKDEGAQLRCVLFRNRAAADPLRAQGRPARHGLRRRRGLRPARRVPARRRAAGAARASARCSSPSSSSRRGCRREGLFDPAPQAPAAALPAQDRHRDLAERRRPARHAARASGGASASVHIVVAPARVQGDGAAAGDRPGHRAS